MKKITIKEIAMEAGVSKATVSRVLNHGEIVDEATKQKVLAVMQKYRYTPSQVARNLSNRDSNTIGVVIPEIDNAFYGKILRTIVNIADEKGLIPICFDTDNKAEKDLKSLQVLKDYQVSGIIYAPSIEYGEAQTKESVREIIGDMNIPVVLIDRNVPELNCSGVFFDNFDAAYRSTKILLKAGHERTAIITGSRKIGISRDRLNGYFKAYEECGIPINERYIFAGDFTVGTAYHYSKMMLEMDDRPDAVLTCNNSLGLGFLQALTEKRMKTPRDIEHIGIDEIDTFDYLHMNYNHVVRSRGEMARKAIELLIDRMNDQNSNIETILIEAGFDLGHRLQRVAVKNQILSKQPNQRRRKNESAIIGNGQD